MTTGLAVNAVVLVVLTAVLMVESVERLEGSDEEDVSAVVVIVLAVLSLVVNIVKIWLLHVDAMESFNVRSVYVHVMADVFGSIATLIAGIWMLCDESNPISSCSHQNPLQLKPSPMAPSLDLAPVDQ